MTEINLTLTRTGASASAASIRDHKVVMDRPIEKGGENTGPMGGEVLLAALGGCFMSNLVAAAGARDIELGDVTVKITGTLAGTPPLYSQISMVVNGQTNIAELPKLVTMAERGCIVANTLKQGVALEVKVEQG